ncbi:MAG: ClpXP protease specificity-enhancing factor [Gammaproteobacteria bacterium]|nr:ClpXP protease specificity-enhancing factor [Gammaproteobacteria bacterium]
MTSSRPYLIRALYEWVLDNSMTPHILVNAELEDVQVPTQFVENGKIVLNVSPESVIKLELGNDLISFNARFSGTPMDVFIPVHAVIALYARENGQGMVFAEEGDEPPTPPEGGGDDDGSDDKPDRSHLRVVK